MSYAAYDSYLSSESIWLDRLPAHWNQLRVKHVIERMESGVSVNSDANSAGPDELGVLKTSCVYGDQFVPQENKRVLEEEVDRIACSVKANRLIISRMNTPELVGSCGYVSQDFPNLFLPDRLWQTVFSKSSDCLPRFAWYYLTSRPAKSAISSLAAGTSGSMQNIAQDAFMGIGFPLPPLDEQQTIVRFLDAKTAQIDTLVAQKRQLIDKLKEKRSALIARTVTRGLPPEAATAAGLESNPAMKYSGVKWLGEIPSHWTTPPLYARYTVELGKMLSESKITGEHLVRYLRNIDVQWNSISFEDLPEMDILPAEYHRYTIRTGDLLVCEGGEVGRSAIVGDFDGVIGYQKALHRFRRLRDDEDQRYMCFVLEWAAQASVFNAGGTSTIAHLTGEQLRKYRFPKPPKNEQSLIVDYLFRETALLAQLVAQSEQVISRLTEYRQALITSAVTGKIDVRDFEVAKETA